MHQDEAISIALTDNPKLHITCTLEYAIGDGDTKKHRMDDFIKGKWLFTKIEREQ